MNPFLSVIKGLGWSGGGKMGRVVEYRYPWGWLRAVWGAETGGRSLPRWFGGRLNDGHLRPNFGRLLA